MKIIFSIISLLLYCTTMAMEKPTSKCNKEIIRSFCITENMKYHANKKPFVSVKTKEVLPLVTIIYQNIEDDIQNTNCLLRPLRAWFSDISKFNKLKQRMNKTDTEMATMSPFEIAHYLMPHLYYIIKISNEKEESSFFRWVQEQKSKIDLNAPDTISIWIDGKQKTLSGQLAQCISAMHCLSNFEKKFNVQFKDCGIVRLENGNSYLTGSRWNHTIIQNISNLLELCHHPCLNAYKGYLREVEIVNDKKNK